MFNCTALDGYYNKMVNCTALDGYYKKMVNCTALDGYYKKMVNCTALLAYSSLLLLVWYWFRFNVFFLVESVGTSLNMCWVPSWSCHVFIYANVIKCTDRNKHQTLYIHYIIYIYIYMCVYVCTCVCMCLVFLLYTSDLLFSCPCIWWYLVCNFGDFVITI